MLLRACQAPQEDANEGSVRKKETVLLPESPPFFAFVILGVLVRLCHIYIYNIHIYVSYVCISSMALDCQHMASPRFGDLMGSETLARSLCRRMVCPAVASLGSFGGWTGETTRGTSDGVND